MMKRDNGKFIFICVSIVLVMLIGLYLDSANDTSVKYEAGKSAYSVEIVPLEPEETKEPILLTDDSEVYISQSGSKFHIKNDCGTMDPENAQKITVKEAEEKGLSPCKVCLKDAQFS